MRKIFFLVLMFSLFTMGEIMAQNEPYNIARALECLENNDRAGAVDYLKKEIAADSKSGKAYDILGYIYYVDEEYGTALSLLNQAVQYIPKKKADDLSSALYHRAGLHAAIGDTISSISDYKAAIKLRPNFESAFTELGDLYFCQKRYSEADVIYQQLIKLDSGNPYPHYGLARNAYNQHDYERARAEIKKGELLDSDKERALIMNMRIEAMTGNDDKSLDFAIQVLKVNDDNHEAYYKIMTLSDSLYQTTVNRVFKQSFEDSDNEYWGYLLSHLYIRHEDYQKAIECLKPLLKNDSELKLAALYWSSECYENLEEEKEVVRMMDIGLDMDSTNAEFYGKRADAKFSMQDLVGAEEDYRKMMEYDREYGYYAYYRIGWIKEIQKQYEDALKCYETGIALNESYAYTYMMKGNLLKSFLSREEEANEAFRSCIIYDKGIGDATCKQYAYLALGDTLTAIAVNDSILAEYKDPGSYYDAACLYSRMGRHQEAIDYLKTAFERGFKRLKHIEMDDDMDNIRDLPEFKALIKEYSDKLSYKEENDYKDVCEYSKVYEIPIRPMGSGLYSVKCKVNELPMDFILDTGCSDVSISSVESNFMLKNGYLKDSDYKGYISYQNASGGTGKAREVNIKEIKVGELTLKNIKASVISNQKAPLLLGQNVLSRFGKIEIDNHNSILRIYSFHEQ